MAPSTTISHLYCTGGGAKWFMKQSSSWSVQLSPNLPHQWMAFGSLFALFASSVPKDHDQRCYGNQIILAAGPVPNFQNPSRGNFLPFFSPFLLLARANCSQRIIGCTHCIYEFVLVSRKWVAEPMGAAYQVCLWFWPLQMCKCIDVLYVPLPASFMRTTKYCATFVQQCNSSQLVGPLGVGKRMQTGLIMPNDGAKSAKSSKRGINPVPHRSLFSSKLL